MKKFVLFIFLFINCIQSFGQNQGNIWYFGNGAGLDFNRGCLPRILTDGKIVGFEGCATIADRATGDLLFYTNSDSVWNRNHVSMPNGHLVTNGNTITQVIIIPKPTYNSIYYIVTSEVQGYSGQGLQYHEVDMNLNGGLGGLVFKDSLLYPSPVTEKITAVRHSNGTDIWLIAHQFHSNHFLSFLVTSAGMTTTPVVSQIGKVHDDPLGWDAIGETKASPDGSKLAAVTLRHPDIELFDFDNSTGQVSNLITLPENGGYDSLGNTSGLYGASFSSNSTMLYVSKWNMPSLNSAGQIMQFNITSNDSATINNSRVNVFTSTSKSLYSLQLAPNRKIYVGQNLNNYIGVINSPDNPGLSCNYADNGLYLDGKLSSWGLNNLMEENNYCSAILDVDKSGKESSQVKIYPNPVRSVATLEFDNPQKEKHNLSVYNSFGQLLLSIDNITTGMMKIDRANLTDGFYYFQLRTERQVIATGKFIVQ